jgi:hypothetical protein
MAGAGIAALGALLLAGLLLISDGGADESLPRTERFRDVAAELGIRSRHAAVPPCGVNSAGGAWGDADDDGDLDLFLPQQSRPSELWLQQADGQFVERGNRAGVSATGLATSAAFADYDNDGDQDLYVGQVGRDRLFVNEGRGAFSDATALAGIVDGGHSTAVAWADFDSDGNLDLHVANGDNCTDEPSPWPNTLLRNRGDGTFEDASALLPAGPSRGVTLDALWIDYDLDGDQDLYLGNDEIGGIPNALIRNDGPAGFADVSAASDAGILRSTMGLASADVNGDGSPDIAITDIGREALLLGRGAETFGEQAEELGFGRERAGGDESITWGIAFADFDADGDEDAYAAAGGLGFDRGVTPDLLHLNDGSGSFSTQEVPAPGSGRAVATADFDRDGDVDVAVGQLDQPQLLLANEGQSAGNWIELRLVGRASARDACGAVVRVRAGGELQQRQVVCRAGAKEVHFGLAEASAVAVTIEWPSGKTQRIDEVEANRLHIVREPRGART